jgi:hypothetical protein
MNAIAEALSIMSRAVDKYPRHCWGLNGYDSCLYCDTVSDSLFHVWMTSRGMPVIEHVCKDCISTPEYQELIKEENAIVKPR